MEKAIEHFEGQLNSLWGGISPGLIDTIKVDYYGQLTPIKHLASTGTDGDRITVVPYDPTLLGIIDSTLKGQKFNSYIFNKTKVAVNIPRFGIGGKEKVIDQIRKLEEEAKVAIRSIRKKTRQNFDLTEDELVVAEKELQVLTDASIARVAQIAKAKIESL
jgi:ribosome recycling factor